MRRLVIRPGAIGDAVVSLPAVSFLKPAEIWCPEVNVPVYEHLAPARSLVGMGLDSLVLSERTLVRLGEFSEIYSWYGSARAEFRAQVAGLPFRFFSALPGEGCGTHACDFYLGQVGGELGEFPLISWPGQGGERRGVSTLGRSCCRGPLGSTPVGDSHAVSTWGGLEELRCLGIGDTGDSPRGSVGEVAEYAVIQPFSGSLRKNWGVEKFRAVALGLGMTVHWCCGPAEELSGALRFESLRELMPFLSGASVYLGNDSGISHLAAALGVPVVAVFGPTDPKIWAPRGNVRVMRFEDSVEDVIAAARSLLR